MNEGLIPRRYAKALFKFALEKGQQERIYSLMHPLEEAFAKQQGLQQTIANPFVADADKRSLLMTASGATPQDDCFADFLSLLFANNRIQAVRSIALAYMSIYRKTNNICRVEVVSAAEIPQSEENRLRRLIERQLDGGTMEYARRVDPDLIGGFVVNIDSQRLDASIKNELKQLRLKLLSN